MDQKMAESIALLRHQIISPVLMDSIPAQLTYFEKMSQKEFDVPGRGPRKYSPGTMRCWLCAYRKHGFQALMPKIRKDVGSFRVITEDLKAKIRELRENHQDLSCIKFYDRLIHEGVLGIPPMGLETLRRFLRAEGLYKKRSPTPRKRFEMRYFGELWTADFMHGPKIMNGKKMKRAVLMAIIDDHSRYIVGHSWGFAENTKLLEIVFKEAILAHGCPDRFYCDNGSAFSSSYLALVSANLGIGLVHSKPYDSPSRGKIERFFRTVRTSFLSDFKETDTSLCLKTLSETFSKWIREHYHQRIHNGIQTRPIDKYQDSVRNYPRKRVDEETLDEHFLVTVHRLVGKDATISLSNVTFEVPPEFIGKRVELKYSQDKPSDVFLYNDSGQRLTKVTPINSQLNGQIYKPTPRISDIALHTIKSGDAP